MADWKEQVELASKLAGSLGLVLGVVNSAILISRRSDEKKIVQQEFEETVLKLKTLEKDHELFQTRKQEDMNIAQGVYKRACGAMRVKMAGQGVDVNKTDIVTNGPHLLDLRVAETACARELRDAKHEFERKKEELEVKIRGLERRM